jgi:cytochrome c-type biogenesis protein CcmH
MTATFAAAAVALTTLALAPLVPALLRPLPSDVSVHASSAPARRTFVGLATLLLAVTAALYSAVGSPDGLHQGPPGLDTAATATPGPAQIEAMVARLAARLQTQPDDAEGWQMLARSYEALGRPADALPAYRELERLKPDDAALLTHHAVTLAQSRGEGLAGEPEALLQRALRIAPDHVPALALAGNAALERGDVAAATRSWQHALAVLPSESELAASLREGLARLPGAPGQRAASAAR